MESPIVICEPSGRPIASGWLLAIDGRRGAITVRRGAAALRAAYFLDGRRDVLCLVDGNPREGRLATRWASNHRAWTVAFSEPLHAPGSEAANPQPVVAA